MAKKRRTETIPSLALPYRAARAGVRLAGDALARYTSKIGTGAVGGAVRGVASNVKTVADYVAAGGRLKDVAGELASSTGAWAGHAARTGLAASFATEGVKSATRQGMKMLEDVGATGGFSKEGWKNLMSVEGVKDIGKGLVGSVMDVASGMTMGYLPNGDKVRGTMSVNRSPYETPVGVNRSPAESTPKPSGFKGTDTGGTAVALQSKAAERRAGLSLAADGAAPMTSDQTAAEEARAKSAETGANYWTQVELANKANSDYADGVISKEERDRAVAGSEAAKGGTGQSGDPGLAGYKSTFGLRGQSSETPADQLNENIAKQNQQAKRSAEFNAYKTVTERQDAELSDVQKAANNLEMPGVSEANHALAKAKTNIELLQTEDKLQAQRDAAEIAQIMGDANEYATPEEDDRLQNPVDRFIAAGQRQHERETARDPLPQIEVDQINRETDALTQSVAQQQQQPVQQQQQPVQQQQQQPAEQTTVQTAEDDAKKRSNGDQADEKGGDGDRFATSRNFLATDKVPDSIFGYPVVSRREDYTPEDLQFFKDHPEAGGYYDLGEGSQETSTEADERGGDTRGGYPGSWNNPGNIQKGEVEYDGEAGSVKSRYSKGSFLKFKTPQDGLNAKAQAIGQIVREKIPKGYRDGRLTSDSFTVSNLINVYAPPEDGNDTEGYIKFVADRMGVGRDQVLDQNDVKMMSSLLDAIIRRDSGHPYADWFTDAERETATKKMKTPAKLRAKPNPEVKPAKKRSPQ